MSTDRDRPFRHEPSRLLARYIAEHDFVESLAADEVIDPDEPVKTLAVMDLFREELHLRRQNGLAEAGR